MLAEIPRRIWFHWRQGRTTMPPVVSGCLNSWIATNPGWEVVFLDGQNVWDYLDRRRLPVDALLATSSQVYANAVRARLLCDQGGVWADATTWCRMPLSEWLIGMPGEFFAFASPGPDRMIANWFMASAKGGYLAEALARGYIGLFERLGPLHMLPHSTTAEMMSQADNTDVFFDPGLLTTRGYPYFLFHYLFAYLYRRDPRFREQWDATPKVSAHACHAAQLLDLSAAADDEARQRLRTADPPMHKLIWSIDPILPGSLLHDIVAGDV
jgi:hypothetical protein